MKKRSIGAFPLLAYIIYLVVGFTIAHDIKVSNPESIGDIGGLASAFSGFTVATAISIVSLYAVLAILPLVLKGIHLTTKLGFFGVLCMLFDLAYSFLHGALLYNTFFDPSIDTTAKAIYAILFVISVSALLSNAKSVSK